MRTLKKTLCLVLTVVMVLGLCTFGVNAQMTTTDYPDADKITNTQAVDILGTIGVLEGDDDGFRPGDTLKRSEGAKIITTMMNVTVPSTATSKFTDAQGHWAEAYIAYCTEQGIIDGMTETTFEPESKLTGAQFAKMLLCALGYDAEIEGLTGSAWILNVASLIKTAKLDTDLAAIPYETAVTRDEAAQMAFNALCAPLVTYNASTNVIVNGIPVTINAGSAIYMTTAVRDTQTISYAQVNDGSSRGTYIVEFAEYYQPKLVRSTLGNDVFGRPATVWTYDRKEVGEPYVNTSIRVVNETKGVSGSTVYKAIGSDLLRQYANNHSKDSLYLAYYIDGVEYDYDDAKVSKDWDNIFDNKTGNLDNSGNGVHFEVYVDEDTYAGANGNTTRVPSITVVVTHTWLAEVSAPATSGDALLTVATEKAPEITGTSVKVGKKDVANIGDFAEGDKVLVTMTYDKDPDEAGAKATVRTVKLANSALDQYVNAYTVDKNAMQSITVEGKKSSVSKTAKWNSKILYNYELENLKGYTYDVYCDDDGNIIGIDFNKQDSSYVFVTGYESSSSYLVATTAKVNAIWTDGVMETLTVRLSSDARKYLQDVVDTFKRGKGTNGTAVVNRWFEASKADNGDITLKNVVTGSAEAGKGGVRQWSYDRDTNEKIDSSTTTLEYSGGFAYGNSKSVYITAGVDTNPIEKGAISEVTGVVTGIKNASIKPMTIDTTKYANFSGKSDDKTGFENYSNVYFLYDSDTGYVLYAIVVSETSGGTPIFITKFITTREYDGRYLDTYKAIVDGEEIDIKVDSGKTGKQLSADSIYMVIMDEDGVIISATKKGVTPADEMKTAKHKANAYAYVDKPTAVSVQGLLLWVTDGEDNNNYIVIDEDAAFYVKVDKGNYNQYYSASSALSAAKDNNKNNVTAVYAICDKGTGYATTLIFTAEAKTNESGIVKKGNVSTTLPKSAANVTYNVTQSGRLQANFTYDVPEYAASGTTLNLTVNAYIKDTKGDFTVLWDSTAKTVNPVNPNAQAGFVWSSSSGDFDPGVELQFEIVSEKLTAVQVKYVALGGGDTPIMDPSASETDKTATVDISQNLKFKLLTTKYNNNVGNASAPYSITGVNNAPVTGTLSSSEEDSKAVTATGKDYVTVAIGPLVENDPTYTVKLDDAWAQKLGANAGFFGNTANTDGTGKSLTALGAHETSTVTLRLAASTVADGSVASINKDTTTNVKLTAELSAIETGYLSATVSVKANGTWYDFDAMDAGDLDQDNVLISLAANTDLIIEDVKVEFSITTIAIESLSRTDTNTYVITFNHGVEAKTGIALAKTTNIVAVDGGTGTLTIDKDTHTASGATVTLVLNRELAAGDKIYIVKDTAYNYDDPANDHSSNTGDKLGNTKNEITIQATKDSDSIGSFKVGDTTLYYKLTNNNT